MARHAGPVCTSAHGVPQKYQRRRARLFSFKSVGIQAQGRTTVLKTDYRNTKQILQTASMVAADLLNAEESGDDNVPLVHPVSCGREGQAPLVVRLPSMHDEAVEIAEPRGASHREGHSWGDMAVICRHCTEMDRVAAVLRHRQLPHELRRGSGNFNPLADTIKILTMHASKGLEFPVVALCGVGQMPAADQSEVEEARLFYVAATRATHRLFIPVSGNAKFASRLASWRLPALPSTPLAGRRTAVPMGKGFDGTARTSSARRGRPPIRRQALHWKSARFPRARSL